jgi:F0F1-type ATP synthase assembly protein I
MGKLAGLGFQLTIAILFCGYLGQLADRWLGTSPWGLIAGAFVGFAAGFYAIYRAAKANIDDGGPPKKSP